LQFSGQGLCPWVSLWLGHDTALTAHRAVIHHRVAASLPRLNPS